ncbi:MAG TPA: sigma-70 family RNA polymerase sigma factor [Lapillicoccus sp.]|jgi:RNA polymerase sigma-70 factor (ECF subfamily)|nr:sigma-70 family RNA polymerase sigma factor [Lapillicoccus sp.]
MARTRTTDRQSAADEALIRALYTEHGRSLLAYATRLTGDRAAAEDIVQETLVRAWKHSDTLVNGKGSVRGWLLTVARNLVTDRARSRAARPTEVAPPADAALNDPHTGQDVATEVVDRMVVVDAMDTLSHEHRCVIRELYFHGRSVSEAAVALGVPPGTVKSRSFYALRAMREALETRRTGPTEVTP